MTQISDIVELLQRILHALQAIERRLKTRDRPIRFVEVDDAAPPRTRMANKEDIEARLVRLWPDAGKTLGYRSRSATYAAANKKVIKTVRLGKLRKVPTDWLRKAAAGEPPAS